MQSAFGTYGYLRHYVASLMLAVFVCIGLIPVGFMPEFSRDGHASVKLCSGIEEKSITLDDKGQPVEHSTKAPCVFSLNASGAPAVQPVVFAPPVFKVSSVYTPIRYLPLAASFPRANLSQGPPAA